MSDRKRVLMLLEAVFPPDVRVEKEIRTLVRAGHEVHVLCYRHTEDVAAEDVFEGARVHRMRIAYRLSKWSRALAMYLPIYSRIWQRFMLTNVHRFAPDVIHVHDLPLALPATRTLARLQGPRPRLLLDLHENYPDLLRSSTFAREFPQRLLFRYDSWVALERRMTRAADHLIVVSAQNADRLRRSHGVAAPITVVPNYVELDAFGQVEVQADTRAHFEPGAINLLYVGGVDPSRGLETVIEGLARVPDVGSMVRFVVVGAGSSEADLAAMAANQGIAERVRFVGAVSQEKVWEFIQCADLCALPLKNTTQNQLTDPNKLYQYAYFGKPVIAADMAHVGARIRDMGCGVTYPADDANGFARVLADLLNRPEDLAAYGEAGRQAVRLRYSWDQAGRALLDAYGQIA